MKCANLKKYNLFQLYFVMLEKVACVRYDVRTKKPLEIRIDLKRCHDIEWAILHETAHQVLLLKYGDPAQKHNLRFRKLQDIFIDKYMYSVLTWKYLAK